MRNSILIKVWDKIIDWGKAQLQDLSSDFQSWTKEDFAKLKDVVKQLVSLIRFVSISFVDFCYKVMPCNCIIPKDLFKKIMCFYLDPNYCTWLSLASFCVQEEAALTWLLSL